MGFSETVPKSDRQTGMSIDRILTCKSVRMRRRRSTTNDPCGRQLDLMVRSHLCKDFDDIKEEMDSLNYGAHSRKRESEEV